MQPFASITRPFILSYSTVGVPAHVTLGSIEFDTRITMS